MNLVSQKLSRFTLASALVALLGTAAIQVAADETCMSPYMAKIVGQEDFGYGWTLGSTGVGDEQCKLGTIDVNPCSPNYGRVRPRWVCAATPASGATSASGVRVRLNRVAAAWTRRRRAYAVVETPKCFRKLRARWTR